MLNLGGIPIEVHKKRIKNLHLYVKAPDGQVLVTAPLSMSDREIEGFVTSKLGWIQKQLAKLEGRPRLAGREYVSGEEFDLWGRRYRLQTRFGGKNTLVLLGDTAVLTVREGSTAKHRERFVRQWYREQLSAEIARMLPKWESATGLRASSWQTKYMTTRWGSCNTGTGKIWLSLQLAQRPPRCLEYVLLHELLHLTEPSHNQRFYALMSRHMPDWQEVKQALNR